MLSQVCYPLILGTILRHYWAKKVPRSDFRALLLKETIITKGFEPKNFGKKMVPHGGSDGSKWGPSRHGHFSGGNKLKLKNIN